jgi:hypothetical protein
MTQGLERNKYLRAAEIKPGTLERVTSNLQGRTAKGVKDDLKLGSETLSNRVAPDVHVRGERVLARAHEELVQIADIVYCEDSIRVDPSSTGRA